MQAFIGTEMQVLGTEMQVLGTEMQALDTEMQVLGTEMQAFHIFVASGQARGIIFDRTRQLIVLIPEFVQ